MNRKILNIAGAFLIASSIASCTGTTKSESTTEADAAVITYDANGNQIINSDENTDVTSNTPNGAGTRAGSGNGSSQNGSGDDAANGNSRETGPGRTESTAINSRDRQTGTTEKDQVKGQYSAPDGTDAENRDGDYYTRNDKTPMPTGTPIK